MFTAFLINDPSGDPGVYLEFKYRREVFLFDLGELQRLPPKQIRKITHIFVSHTHVDHFIGFDHLLRRFTGTTLKTMPMRIIHAILFEAGLLLTLMPFIAWYLGISLWQAFVMDVAFALFYLVYAFVFNWAYDRLFPLPEWQTEKAAAAK